jgi:transposase
LEGSPKVSNLRKNHLRPRNDTSKGNKALNAAVVQAAHAASHIRNTYLSSQYHHLAGRRGKKRAIVAVAHSILMIAYHLIHHKEPYRDLGSDFFDKRRPESTAKRLLKCLERLGYDVSQVELSSFMPISA